MWSLFYKWSWHTISHWTDAYDNWTQGLICFKNHIIYITLNLQFFIVNVSDKPEDQQTGKTQIWMDYMEQIPPHPSGGRYNLQQKRVSKFTNETWPSKVCEFIVIIIIIITILICAVIFRSANIRVLIEAFRKEDGLVYSKMRDAAYGTDTESGKKRVKNMKLRMKQLHSLVSKYHTYSARDYISLCNQCYNRELTLI